MFVRLIPLLLPAVVIIPISFVPIDNEKFSNIAEALWSINDMILLLILVIVTVLMAFIRRKVRETEFNEFLSLLLIAFVVIVYILLDNVVYWFMFQRSSKNEWLVLTSTIFGMGCIYFVTIGRIIVSGLVSMLRNILRPKPQEHVPYININEHQVKPPV